MAQVIALWIGERQCKKAPGSKTSYVDTPSNKKSGPQLTKPKKWIQYRKKYIDCLLIRQYICKGVINQYSGKHVPIFQFPTSSMKNKNLHLSGVLIATLAMASGILLLAGCTNPTNEQYTQSVKDCMQIIVIDNCQYIVIDDGLAKTRVFSLTHKGNCTNSIHVINK